jgi:dienelactone hydrolase
LVHREWVTVNHDGRPVETFVVYPESKDKTPVVLVIHEIFGLTDWVEGQYVFRYSASSHWLTLWLYWRHSSALTLM